MLLCILPWLFFNKGKANIGHYQIDETLEEIINVAYAYNWGSNGYTFPVRGCLIYDEIIHADYSKQNEKGGKYVLNSVFGKGLVNAYLKAENQNWAGAIIDDSIIDKINVEGWNQDKLIGNKAIPYMVPFKDNPEKLYYAFKIKIGNGFNEEAYRNIRRSIIDAFKAYNKSIEDKKIRIKIYNTLQFLRKTL